MHCALPGVHVSRLHECSCIRDDVDPALGQAVHNDVVVAGSGPTGVATALMLARHGVQVTIVTRETWVADSPRAHITNQRPMEIMRALNLEAAVRARFSARHHGQPGRRHGV
ncbi:FAD-dependent oxidoreductase [Mycetocola sp.]|uniref:FAD-dependent oxidoreductase n=1 Tax=Mycetocola sp. TaxID=1871042 RepID=UPI00398A1F70